MHSDGTNVTGIFNYRSDPLLKENLLGKLPKAKEREMANHMNALIQSYMQRMEADSVAVR